MKKFLIAESEKNRILSMHKRKTKMFYLNEDNMESMYEELDELNDGDGERDDFSEYEELGEANEGDGERDDFSEYEGDLSIYDVPGDNSQQITEAASVASVNRNKLVDTYKHYNDLGSAGTFDEIFKPQREANKEPFSLMNNGCATKVSLALQAAGKKVPPGFKVTSGPMEGKTIQTSAAGLKEKLGKPDFQFTGAISEDELLKKFGENKTAILICSPCGFSSCTGHATVWSRHKGAKKKGGTMDNSTYHLNNPDANISMWQLVD
jgi:hypothetical protein